MKMFSSPKNLIPPVFGLGLILMASLGAPMASGSTTYTYTGHDFTIIDGGAGSDYTTSDFVSGSFTVDTALADSLPLGNIQSDPGFTFSFSDGIQTFTNLVHPAGVLFQIQTDASGNVEYWNIQIGYVSNNPEVFTAYYTDPPEPSNVNEDSGQNSTGAGIQNDLPPGTWATSNSAAPEPSSFVLMFMGLLGAAFIARKRVAAYKG
jgi:hypothetical protein